MNRFGLFVATCGYLGYVPVAPGTFGSALGLVLLFAVRSSGSVAVELFVIAAVFVVGLWSGTIAERREARDRLEHLGRQADGRVDEEVGDAIGATLATVRHSLGSTCG